MNKTVWKAPRHVKARTPEMLTRAMVENNLRQQIEFNYFNIGKQDDEWFAWYLADVSDLVRVTTEDLDG